MILHTKIRREETKKMGRRRSDILELKRIITRTRRGGGSRKRTIQYESKVREPFPGTVRCPD